MNHTMRNQLEKTWGLSMTPNGFRRNCFLRGIAELAQFRSGPSSR